MSSTSERQVAIRFAGLLPLLLVTSTLAFAPKPAQAQVTIVGCGTEGGRVCGSSDPEYLANNIDATGQPCDYGLIVSGTTCVNGNRHTKGDYRSDAIGKALHDQLYSAQADQPVTYDVFLGSHNSFSSYRSDIRQKSLVQTGIQIPIVNKSVGIAPDLIADQELSVSDQLTRGARFIVLHPHFYLNQLRVCHENAGDWAETLICANETYGRLFSYVVQEIATWLDDNPGEFVLLRLLHDVGASHTDQITEILNNYLGSKIYKPDYQTWFTSPLTSFGGQGGVPSLRKLRSQGHQIMIIGTETDGPNQPISSIMWNWGNIVENDGYSDSDGWGSCKNTDGNSILNHPTQFAYTAEDRSGSNAITAAQVAVELAAGSVESGVVQVWNGFVNFVTGSDNSSSSYYNPGGAGLLDQNAVRHALACTYSIIGLDFWESGPNAYSGALYPPFIPYADYQLDLLPTDPRQRAALFSYQPAGPTPGFTTPEPVYTNGMTGWQPDTENGGHIGNQFLCAGLGSTAGVPVNRFNLDGWALKISSSAAEWEQGESVCLSEFGLNWHFWAPETPHEQSNVDSLVRVLGYPVWLNTKVAPPGQRPPLVVTPSAVTIYWHKGQQALPTMPYMFTKGGTGGTLSTKPSLANGEQSLFVLASNNGATLWAAFDRVALSNLSAGDHYNNIVITETDPVYGPMTYTVPVMVEVDEMLQVSAPSVNLGNCPGPTQAAVQVQTGGPFTIASTEPWLKVAASATQAPATLTFSVLPSANLSPVNYTAVVTISGQFAINSSVTVKVNLKVSAETNVSSSPIGLSLHVDGALTVTPKTYCWAPGSPHTVSAPAAIPGATGSELEFSKWSDAGAIAHTITPGNTIATVTADYSQAYLVTVNANPAAGGTVSGGGWYSSGQAASISATPNPGFTFSSFSDPQSTTANPLSLPVAAPLTVTANFSAAPSVSLTATPAGPLTEGRQDGTRNLPLKIVDTGAAAVAGVVVTAVDQISTVDGTGTVVALSTFPINVGPIRGGGSGSFNLLLRWPGTAGKVTFVVHFTANNGTYSGSTKLTVTRSSGD